MAEGMRGFLSAWEGWRAEADDIRELDDERVLVLEQYRGRGRTSGVELGQMRTRGANVIHIRGGKVTRFVVYLDRERALADLGLTQKPTPTGGASGFAGRASTS